MNTAPSEASILRSLYEKEVQDHAATKLKLEQLRVALEHTLQLAARFGVDDVWP